MQVGDKPSLTLTCQRVEPPPTLDESHGQAQADTVPPTVTWSDVIATSAGAVIAVAFHEDVQLGDTFGDMTGGDGSLLPATCTSRVTSSPSP